ncbi:MAG: aspartate kinase, partial [Cycloclasticus sp.]|nr:aspartate kinase [Cycloclasticus sp.]MBQ0789723.1 aspartate kinase [Cycloclasticus sp.]
MHTVEKIGGTSMSNYVSVRDNIILNQNDVYRRIFVVSAYAGITDALLEHKKSSQPGIYGLFASGIEDDSWLTKCDELHQHLQDINLQLFGKT